jgi:hypothetical protein
MELQSSRDITKAEDYMTSVYYDRAIQSKTRAQYTPAISGGLGST